MEKECWIRGTFVNVEIEVHGVGDVLLGVSAQETSIADRMKPQRASGFGGKGPKLALANAAPLLPAGLGGRFAGGKGLKKGKA
jgi:hypothetical protein